MAELQLVLAASMLPSSLQRTAFVTERVLWAIIY